MKQQQRFILALVASAVVLIAWNYLFPPPKPPSQPNANVNANANVAAKSSATTSPTAHAQSTATANNARAAASPAPSPEGVPQRRLRVVTPLYEATFDTKGAVTTSWIIKKNEMNGHDLYAVSSTKSNPKPLELIPSA